MQFSLIFLVEFEGGVKRLMKLILILFLTTKVTKNTKI